MYATFLCLTACAISPPRLPTPTPAPTTPAPGFVRAPAAAALPGLIAAERQAAIHRDLAALAELWGEDSRIVDGRGTADVADDLIWQGRAAVLDRYSVAVFPNPPPPLMLPTNAEVEAAMEVVGTTATLRLGTDQWRFVHQAGRWWLAELRYH